MIPAGLYLADTSAIARVSQPQVRSEPTIFAALLDDERGGRFRIAPALAG